MTEKGEWSGNGTTIQGSSLDIGRGSGNSICDGACRGSHLRPERRHPGNTDNVCHVDSWTPLHQASQIGRLKVVKELIKSGADIHAKGNNGNTPTPLYYASYWVEVAQYLKGVIEQREKDK